MSNPFNQLASLLDRRISKQSSQLVSGVPCELATVTSSGIKLDTFKHEIQDYLLADWFAKLSIPSFEATGTQTGHIGTTNFQFNPIAVEGVHIEIKPNLKPGDRVLVIPVNGGQDVVVICKVVS
ncbi:hypothetical protein [Desulforamulus aquiferis]|uniref:Uncharacterized protein n=1 Tax=Desulforamulus aquiferis TaxID=1397668 RepID=A0AAW7ZCU8_9FIRM|nr:hypothetical protein [Desulforamulus aquiferis]MDO7787517.1 hypothetical protein [Desulforamulus aquiferis]RYD01652.1 hypothetical protein N752_29175 [Desulforamulus aquiferis]